MKVDVSGSWRQTDERQISVSVEWWRGVQISWDEGRTRMRKRMQ